MDKVADSGSADAGSIPARDAKVSGLCGMKMPHNISFYLTIFLFISFNHVLIGFSPYETM